MLLQSPLVRRSRDCRTGGAPLRYESQSLRAFGAPVTAAGMSIPGYRPTYSYRLARPMSVWLCVQARQAPQPLSGAFTVKKETSGHLNVRQKSRTSSNLPIGKSSIAEVSSHGCAGDCWLNPFYYSLSTDTNFIK